MSLTNSLKAFFTAHQKLKLGGFEPFKSIKRQCYALFFSKYNLKWAYKSIAKWKYLFFIFENPNFNFASIL